MQNGRLTGARVILEGSVEDTSVTIEDGKIVAVGDSGGPEIDCSGLLLAPAMIDVHGDAFERQVMPRPGTFFSTDSAVLETDRQLGANGIGTAYHALTLSWEPGLRSVERGAAFCAALSKLQPRLTVENRLQLRWETFCFEAIPLIEKELARSLTPSLAFNDHTSMAVLDPSISLHNRPFDLVPDYPVTDLAGSQFRSNMSGRAERSGLSKEDYVDRLCARWAMRPDVPEALARVAALGRQHGAPMLSHDDSQLETRDFYRGLGANVAEFPMRIEVAEAARAAGDLIVFGAPNARRGGSHLGSPTAGDMVEAGLCDVLASDYFYPAMLGAVDRLVRDKRASLPQAWGLVSTGPAKAMGLTDRGRIAPGLRADLVAVDWPTGEAPGVKQLWVAGRTAYSTL